METKSAIIKRDPSKTYLVLDITPSPLEIILTEDNPNSIKSVFNTLLKELKKGLFQFNLEDETDDLYYNICIEYIAQLNEEIKNVYTELDEFGLLEE